MAPSETPEPTAARWREIDRAHHLHPFTDYKEFAALGGRIMTRGEGVYVWDSEGAKRLDAMAGLWCVNVGHGRRELARAARDQMERLAYYNTFFKTATPPAAELAGALAEITPEGFDHVFFCNSGSEANDSIVKIARYYWKLRGRPEKKLIVARDYAYHGVTLASASLSGLPEMHAQFDLPLPGLVARIRAPYGYREGAGQDARAYGLEAAGALEAKIRELGPERIAAFIGEPIMGAGGVLVPPAGYWPEIRRICDAHDILLVSDEVICGFGRTGAWFGCDAFGFRPDLMTLAKGLSSGYLPIAGVMVGAEVARALIDAGEEFVHGFTYSGHPVACAVALENLRILQAEAIVERVGAETGPYFQQSLAALADHPLVGEARGLGLLGAVELVADKETRTPFEPEGRLAPRIRDWCFEHGLIVRAVRDSLLLAPPLVISPEEIDEIAERLRAGLDWGLREAVAA